MDKCHKKKRPRGWYCGRAAGHTGSCALWEKWWHHALRAMQLVRP